jgi:hypothetical protein
VSQTSQTLAKEGGKDVCFPSKKRLPPLSLSRNGGKAKRSRGSIKDMLGQTTVSLRLGGYGNPGHPHVQSHLSDLKRPEPRPRREVTFMNF